MSGECPCGVSIVPPHLIPPHEGGEVFCRLRWYEGQRLYEGSVLYFTPDLMHVRTDLVSFGRSVDGGYGSVAPNPSFHFGSSTMRSGVPLFFSVSRARLFPPSVDDGF